jgi:UDP:flavonoid glycosyltransferase YjiC (YdhE family)
MSERLRIMVATGDSPGHVFPEIALARALQSRGHEVLVQTTERWAEVVEEAGAQALVIDAMPDVLDRPTFDHALVEAARAVQRRLGDFGADIVVADVGAAAPPLAAELSGARTATLIPTVYPVQGPGLPFYSLGLSPARTALGRLGWRAATPLDRMRGGTRWLREGSRRLSKVREELGLAPLDGSLRRITTYGTLSETLVLVATFPQLEYPRRWPAHVHVTGPMLFERPYPDVELPGGEGPLVLVAASTAQDPEGVLLHAAIDALAGESVRVLATMNRLGARWHAPVPDDLRVTDWVSYAQVMPSASLVVCSGGHGTVARSLAGGAPVLVAPRHGDQPENGARVAWSGAGLMLPRRALRAAPLRWAVRRLLEDRKFAARAASLAVWSRANDGAARGAELVEEYARA